MQCQVCEAELSPEAKRCACGWRVTKDAQRLSGHDDRCQATRNFERCCTMLADPDSNFCRRHAYLDGRMDNPNRFYDGPGVTYQPPSPRSPVTPTSSLAQPGPPAPDDYFVQRAVMRHVREGLSIGKAMQEEYEAACQRGEVDAAERQRMGQFLAHLTAKKSA